MEKTFNLPLVCE